VHLGDGANATAVAQGQVLADDELAADLLRSTLDQALGPPPEPEPVTNRKPYLPPANRHERRREAKLYRNGKW
jgi:hypothetical protein